MDNQDRVEVYDWLRLIATVFVVIGHSAYLSIQTAYGGVNYILPNNVNVAYYSHFNNLLRFLSGWVYGFHMPLFFMLSGAVLAVGKNKPFDIFLKSKVKRLIIPYFLYGWFFMLPIKYIGNFYDKNSLFLAMKGFSSGVDSGHLWFLIALFWCMIIFEIIRLCLSKITNSKYILLLVSGCIYITYNYLPFDIFCLKMGLSYIFWFALGYVFEIERKENKQWNYRKTILAIVIMVFVEFENIKYDFLSDFFVIVVGSFLTYLISDLCSRKLRKWTETKLWKIINRNLFNVYLFHDPLEYVVLRVFFSRNFLSSNLGCYMYTITRTLVIFVFCILLGELIRVIKGAAITLLNSNYSGKKIYKHKEMWIVLIFIIIVGGLITGIKYYEDRNPIFCASNITDENWTNGILNSNTTEILFENTSLNLEKLQKATKIIKGDDVFNIVNVENDSLWIHVFVDRDASVCAYPSILTIE